MGVVLRAHPVRGESHIQRSANGEVATTVFATLSLQGTKRQSSKRRQKGIQDREGE